MRDDRGLHRRPARWTAPLQLPRAPRRAARLAARAARGACAAVGRSRKRTGEAITRWADELESEAQGGMDVA